MPDCRRVVKLGSDEAWSGEDLLEDYLEHLVAPLIGIVPFPERRAFRNEVCAHLEGLIQERADQTDDVRKATEAALLEFGEPWLVGKSFLQEWLQGSPSQPPAPLIRKATTLAFAFFGSFSFLTLLLIESQSLGRPREFLLPVACLLAFLAPFVAGSLTGLMAPAQAERGVRNSVLFLSLHSFLTGALMLPNFDGFVLGGWQLIFWVPAGRVSATATASFLRHYWRQRYWHIAPSRSSRRK